MEQPENKKRKKYSKNKKKSWKKHTDIHEVEEYLEDQRLQERTGGLVAEKSNDELFVVDKWVKSEPEESAPRKKRQREERPLKCHALLEPHPKIKPAVIVTDTHDADPAKKKSIRVIARENSGLVTAKAKQAKLNREAAKTRKQQLVKAQQRKYIASYDLWNDKEKNSKEDKPETETQKASVKVPSSCRKKPSGVPAVEPAHPGASYNPTYTDHQELLKMALDVEVAKEKAEKRITNALDLKFPCRSEYSQEGSWMKEMSQGLGGDDDNSDDGSEDDDVDNEDRLSCNPPVRRDDKKTLRQRRKEKLRLLKEIEAKKEKDARIKKNELFRLKSIKKEIALLERQLAARQQRRLLNKQENADNPKKLGKLKYESTNLEIKLTDELEGSLRQLKPEGNLFEDRFNSLQKRNIIEPRLPAKRTKKYKRKKFTRKPHAVLMDKDGVARR